ncbi:MAG: ATP-binding protein [Betaproteobacteria bacterium]
MTPVRPRWVLPLRGRWRRTLLWASLLLLLGVAQGLLLLLTVSYESSRAQDQAEAMALEAAAEVKRQVTRGMQDLQPLTWPAIGSLEWEVRAEQLLASRRELLRLETRSLQGAIERVAETRFGPPPFAWFKRSDMGPEIDTACSVARRTAAPAFTRSYYVPFEGGMGVEVMDLCVPLQTAGQAAGFLVTTWSLPQLLEATLGVVSSGRHELSFVESDGSRLARAGAPRGVGVYVAERIVDLPGRSLLLRVDSAAGRPSLIPNLAVALVLGLSLALTVLVLLLARDARRRAQAEAALAEALAFRKAMEDSLSTGLRARDLAGRITYVNPAFCAMVGFSVEELLGNSVPPYWPPEQVQVYAQRQALRLTPDAVRGPVAGRMGPAGPAGPAGREGREGFETLFMRRDGERFPVMIYEAPLVDGGGRHTGWMSAVLDVTEQRRVEDLARQQQERLQASARLATVGEMASLLSHELNQPLAAIASYASACLNLAEQPEHAEQPSHPSVPGMLREALQRIGEQAERAGRVIRSVHDFVRRRDQQREVVDCAQLLDAVLPLVRLQTRKSGTRVEVELPDPVPQVRCDRTMVEQVLLNLARNGIQSMETDTPLPFRVLRITVTRPHPRWVEFGVIDAGGGIAPEVSARLFTPFFSTRPDGMGLGLSLCRTVVEQHGGALDFDSPASGGSVQAGCPGTRFRFTLPAD